MDHQAGRWTRRRRRSGCRDVKRLPTGASLRNRPALLLPGCGSVNDADDSQDASDNAIAARSVEPEHLRRRRTGPLHHCAPQR